MDKNQKLRNAVRVELINLEDDMVELKARVQSIENTMWHLKKALTDFDEQDAEDVWYTT